MTFYWTTGSPDRIQEPTSTKKLLGFTKGERPTFKLFNWVFYIVGKWISYLYSVFFIEEVFSRNFLIDATTGDINYNLPPAIDGISISITKIDSTSNVVNLIPDGTDTIEDASSYQLTQANSSVLLTGSNNKWYIFEKRYYG